LDLGIAIPLLIVVSAPLLLLSVPVSIIHRKLLFRQKRAGLRGAPFSLLKLATMREAYDQTGRLLPDDERLTRLGGWLRRCSLDELPSLWNVICGDLSLVGPRPLRIEYSTRYSPAQAERLRVKPGVTGLVQVRGRNALSWDEKFALDLEYVKAVGFWLDLRLLAETAMHLVRPKGITHDGHATMPEFNPDSSDRR
jgi:sugar transferase EpsL